ncbi:MAG TPA: peptidoglycan-binding protein [Coriobacteriia bacterium]|nr:peptidoglycan-binding protein [Coriobacteriia bacterium]
MRPIRPGDRGPAVEDIQRRLRALGYDLGRAGIDGIFLGATADAVRSFQRELDLHEDGFVGDLTWSALVDATFTLGDRMLYLRMPHFHGNDVRVLQTALNVLGFACGVVDGIFGAYTERAVREFQRNTSLHADGIVGSETVAALTALRHVWEGKDPRAHSAAHLAPARAAEVLSQVSFAVSGLDETGERVAGRLLNLALATADDSRVSLINAEAPPPENARLVLRISRSGTSYALSGCPVVSIEGDSLAPRLLTAASSSGDSCPEIVVELGRSGAEAERDEQRAAVALLDAVCVLFA